MMISVGNIGVVGAAVRRRGGGAPTGFGFLTLNGKYLTLNGKRLMMENSSEH